MSGLVGLPCSLVCFPPKPKSGRLLALKKTPQASNRHGQRAINSHWLQGPRVMSTV